MFFHALKLSVLESVPVVFYLKLFFDSLAVAKLDVLDTFEEVKIGISYKHKGKVLDSFPGKKTSFFFHKTVVGVSKTPTLGQHWDFSFSAFHVASFSFFL